MMWRIQHNTASDSFNPVYCAGCIYWKA